MSKKSPFESVHKSMDAVFTEYHGWNMPAHYGNTESESKALNQSCTIFDLCPFTKITLKGDQGDELLDKLTATDLTALTEGKWIWAIICDKKGSLIDIVRLFRVNGQLTILASPSKSEKIIKTARQCRKQHGLKNIDIENITDKTGMLGLYGPKALEALTTILPIDISDLQPGEIIKKSFFMIPVTIIRGSFLGCDGIEMLCSASAASLAASAVIKYKDRANISPAGTETFANAAIETSSPIELINSPHPENLSPVSLGLKPLIDFNKDFNGRDAVIKASEKGTPLSLAAVKTKPVEKPHYNLKVQYDDREIGFCDRLANIPSNPNAVAMAMIDPQYLDLDTQIQLVSDDMVMPAELIKLPLDSEKTPDYMTF